MSGAECIFWYVVQDEIDLLVVRLDREPPEETSKGLWSIPVRARPRGFHEAAVYSSQLNNHGTETCWQSIKRQY